MLACVLGLAFVISGCSSSSSPAATTTPTTQTTVNISGKTITDDDPLTPLADVTIKGFYSDTDVTSSVTSAADGSFTLPVTINKAVSAQASKLTYATLNTAKRAFPASIDAGNIELVTVSDVNLLISGVFGEGLTLNQFAWLAVDVVNEATQDDVAGVTITVTGVAPVAIAYLDCSGLNASQISTVVDENPCDKPVAYLAYFDVGSTEVTVSIGSDSELIPVRRGEVSYHEFEQ